MQIAKVFKLSILGELNKNQGIDMISIMLFLP
jgi:hypothetical protein